MAASGTSFVPWEGACKPIVKNLQPLLFNDSASNGDSVRDVLPNSGSCFSYKLPVITYPTSPCSSSTNGTLTLELWLTNKSGYPIDPRIYMPGIHLVAARTSLTSSGYPSVKSLYNGRATYQPAYVPDGSDYTLKYAQIDASSISHARTSQRVVIPVGSAFDYTADTTQSWSFSIANMNAQPAWDSSVYFSIRATCLPTQPPCPKSGPYMPPCSGRGTCGQLPQPTCSCDPGFGGSSCGYPYTNLTSPQSSPTRLQVPGQAWAYFTVTVPDSPAPNDLTAVAANVLAELTTPGQSQPTYQTVLIMSPRGLNSDDSRFDPPSLVDPYDYSQTDIDSMYFNTNSPCTSGPTCSLPYQGQYYKYRLQRLSTTDLKSWWIGVYNNAPWSSNTSTFNLTLKARWTISTALNSASALCPLDCSGQGICSSPSAYALSSMQPQFVCNCNSRLGGPYCQGPQANPTISNTYALYDSSPIVLQAGGWQFYMVSGLNGAGTQPNFFVDFTTTSLPNVQPLTLIFAPYVSNSVGNLYFRPDLSYVLTSSNSYTVPTSGSVNTWIFGVYNSNVSLAGPSPYRLRVYYPSSSSSTNVGPSMLQLIIIGGVSGFILILLIFMAIKLLLMRRYIIQRQEIILIQQQIMTAEARRRGVPQDIIATFPTFEFDPEEFKKELAQREEEKKDTPPPPPLPPPAESAAKQSIEPKPSTSTGHSSPSTSTMIDKRRGEMKGDKDDLDLEAGSNDLEENRVKTEASRSDGDEKEEDGIFSDGDADAEDPVKNGDQEGFELPQCSICIGDFEEGETLRRLPCNHLFHKTCIDQWMTTHTTCPNCRRGLCPRPTTARHQPRRTRREANRPAAAAAGNRVQPQPTVTVAELIAAAEQQQQQARAQPRGEQQQGVTTRPDDRLMNVIRSLTTILNRQGSTTDGGNYVELQVVPAASPLAASVAPAAIPLDREAPPPRATSRRAQNDVGSLPEAVLSPFSDIGRPDRPSAVLTESLEELNQPGQHSEPVRNERRVPRSRAVAESITPRSLNPTLSGPDPADAASSDDAWQLPGSPERREREREGL